MILFPDHIRTQAINEHFSVKVQFNCTIKVQLNYYKLKKFEVQQLKFWHWKHQKFVEMQKNRGTMTKGII